MSFNFIESDTPEPSLRSLLEKRAIELFRICDMETKGFINKKDMQQLCGKEAGFTPQILEEVFESLDADSNGYLTLDEFIYGFCCMFDPEGSVSSSSQGYGTEENNDQTLVEIYEEIDDEFKRTMEGLGAVYLVKNSGNDVKELWARLRREDSRLLSAFETLIGNVVEEVNQFKSEFSMLESVMQK